MRLDKYLSGSGAFSRSEAGKVVRAGRITVNGAVVKDPSLHIDETTADVRVAGEPVRWTRYHYVMLNKPAGYISATDDGVTEQEELDEAQRGKTVMSLLPPAFTRLGMFPCGRLDIDTVGLLLITDDGPTAHELLSPRHHAEKTYRFTCSVPLDEEKIRTLEGGIQFKEFTSKPCTVQPEDGGLSGEITLTEGKFHQIKRMFHAVGAEITSLERVSFAALRLDPKLKRGEWRELTEEEIASLLKRP